MELCARKRLAEIRHHHSLTVAAQNASADLTALTEPRARVSKRFEILSVTNFG